MKKLPEIISVNSSSQLSNKHKVFKININESFRKDMMSPDTNFRMQPPMLSPKIVSPGYIA